MLVEDILIKTELESQLPRMLFDTISEDVISSIMIVEIDYDYIFDFAFSFLENIGIFISVETMDSILRQCLEYIIFESYNNYNTFDEFISMQDVYTDNEILDGESENVIDIIISEVLIYVPMHNYEKDISNKLTLALHRLFKNSNFIEMMDGISKRIIDISLKGYLTVPLKWKKSKNEKYRYLSLACYS